MNAILIFVSNLCFHLLVGEVKSLPNTDSTSMKRSDGLMRDLVNLLMEEKEERKEIQFQLRKNRGLIIKIKKQLKDVQNAIKDKSSKTSNQINKLKRQIRITENTVIGLSRKNTNQFTEIWKQINFTRNQSGRGDKGSDVGFTVSIGTDKDYNGSDTTYYGNQVIIFKNVITNYGNHYNKQNGKFTCKVSGLYIIQLHVTSSNSWAGLWIIKNGQRLVRTSSTNLHVTKDKETNEFAFENSDVSLVVRLNQGDKIWVKSPAKMTIDHHTYFSGALVSV